MKYAFLISAFLFCVTAEAQVMYFDSKDWQGAELKDKEFRKRISENHITEKKCYFYKLNSASDTTKSYLMYDSRYDSEGRMTEFFQYRSNGKIKYHTTYAWNENGKMTEQNDFKPNGKLLVKNTISYDAAGNITDERNYWKGEKEPGWHAVSTYDDKQNILTLKFLTKNDKKLNRRYEYSYYPFGSKKQTVEYNGKGKVLHTWNYDCNPVGVLQANAFKDSSKICIRYETDKDGNSIKVKEQNVKQGAIVRLIAKYDARDNEIFSAGYNSAGKAKTHRESVFDSQNRCTEATTYKPYSDEVKWKFVVRYDSTGNETEALGYKSSAHLDHVLKYYYSK